MMDAERVHNFAIQLLKANLIPPAKVEYDPSLRSYALGHEFSNPIGLAAGFDKNAVAVSNLCKLGFGFIEVGTVTPKSQDGNPKPRLFRLPADDAIINRLGFNNDGLELFKERLKVLKKRANNTIVGANIGKNKDTTEAKVDYVKGVQAVAEFADYITVNISSPNTPGLRDLQKKNSLRKLLAAVLEEKEKSLRRPPVVVKISPDLETNEIKEIAETALELNVDGLIATNTTTDERGSLKSYKKTEIGGLSGRPLKDKSTQALRLLYRYTGGRIPIIGVGGVFSGKDAYQKIRSGASLVQIYSAFIFQGPHIANNINSNLSYLLKRDGYKNIRDAVGVDVSL